jgi:hypothetical protein
VSDQHMPEWQRQAVDLLTRGIQTEMGEIRRRLEFAAGTAKHLRDYYGASAKVPDSVVTQCQQSLAAIQALSVVADAHTAPPPADRETRSSLATPPPGEGLPKPRMPRRSLGKPVHEVITDLLVEHSPEPLTISDLERLLRQRGFETTSANPRNVIGNNAAKAASLSSGRILRLGGGKYRYVGSVADHGGEAAPAAQEDRNQPEVVAM